MTEKCIPPQHNTHEVTLTVKAILGRCHVHQVGDTLIYRNDQIHLEPNKGFCFWALHSISPLLTVLSRTVTSTDRDWLPRIQEWTCPDPKGEVKFKITRTPIPLPTD